MTRYAILRENFQALTWDQLPGHVEAPSPERAVRYALNNRTDDIFGTYVAVPTDEFEQFMEGRTRVVVSAHVETLEPVGVSEGR